MNYYINENGQQYGPFTIDQLRMRGITGETPVWCEGMPQWTKAQKVPELYSLIIPQQNYPYQQAQQRPTEPCPNNHMTMAIIATVMTFLCCRIIGGIFGILSIVSANKVDSNWRLGNYNEAYRQADKAKTWAIASFIAAAIGLIISVLYVIFVIEVIKVVSEPGTDYYVY